jgi:flagellar hook-length control protein FliK
MMSNVALQKTDSAGSAASATGDTGASSETGDTGAFDALLALQSMADVDAASALAAQMAGALEGAGNPELDNATDDSSDDGAEALPDDALWFLAALLPTPQKPEFTAAAGSSASLPIQNDALPVAVGAMPPTAGAAGTADDLAQAFASVITDASGGDSKSASAIAGAATPVIDTTTWNSLTGPAELFAHGTRQGTAERVEAASLSTHVRDPRWVEELGNRLASMVRTGDSSASLQLSPADLGPLEVNVSVRDQQATVHFGAANAETRALLEASIPRLREMLAAQGFSLMDSSVSQGFARQTRHEAAGTPRVDAIGESPASAVQAIHISGLLDLYA